VPEINMLHFLPDILDGIFQMLDDQFEIQRMCETLLLQFLKNIKHDPSSVDLPKMTNILILHAQNGNNELIQLTAINWIREFLNISGVSMLSYSSGIFTAILPCLAYEADSKKSELTVDYTKATTQISSIQFQTSEIPQRLSTLA
jgi:vacuole morphology and inheritance protein 14